MRARSKDCSTNIYKVSRKVMVVVRKEPKSAMARSRMPKNRVGVKFNGLFIA